MSTVSADKLAARVRRRAEVLRDSCAGLAPQVAVHETASNLLGIRGLFQRRQDGNSLLKCQGDDLGTEEQRTLKLFPSGLFTIVARSRTTRSSSETPSNTMRPSPSILVLLGRGRCFGFTAGRH